MTYVHPWNIQLQLLENTTKLDAESTLNPAKESLGRRRTDLNNNRKGDIAELYVSLIAQWKGAEVFRNLGCTGKTDIVLKIDGNLVEIDVKLASYYKTDRSYCWVCNKARKVQLPVYPVIVIPDGDIMDWKIRWKKLTTAPNSPPHCPSGLEDFWSNTSTNVLCSTEKHTSR